MVWNRELKNEITNTSDYHIHTANVSKLSYKFVVAQIKHIAVQVPVLIYIVWCRYNAFNFLLNHHKRRPIGHPLEQHMVCLLCIWNLIQISHLSLHRWMQHHVIFGRVITTLEYIYIYIYIYVYIYSNMSDRITTTPLLSCHMQKYRCNTLSKILDTGN